MSAIYKALNVALLFATQYSNATAAAHLITIGSYPQPATVVNLAPMAYKRAFHTSVVTPDGKIFIFGGQVSALGGGFRTLAARPASVPAQLISGDDVLTAAVHKVDPLSAASA